MIHDIAILGDPFLPILVCQVPLVSQVLMQNLHHWHRLQVRHLWSPMSIVPDHVPALAFDFNLLFDVQIECYLESIPVLGLLTFLVLLLICVPI